MSEKVDDNWERDDREYQEHKIEGVEPAQEGWTLRLMDGLCLFCTNEQCKVEPKAGETARLYGRGFGYTVRGIIIESRVYRYLTAEQEEQRHAEQFATWERERQEREAKHREEIARGQHAPVAFRVKEELRAWYDNALANNQDPYGRACYLFAADWAALMEKQIAEGKTVADIAKAASREADQKHGVTGFMYGAAVSILSHAWEHGEELRRWHNLDTAAGSEGERANESGGVLNPALLNVAIPTG